MTIQKIAVADVQNVSYMADRREVVVLMRDGDRSYDVSLPVAHARTLVDQLVNALKLAREGEA